MKNVMKIRTGQKGHVCQRSLCLVLLLAMMAGIFPLASSGTAFAAEKELICGMEEHEHTVEAGCYEDMLTCELPDTGGHVHGITCYERVLVCTTPEHVHTDACYAEEEAAENTAAPAEETENTADPTEEEDAFSGGTAAGTSGAAGETAGTPEGPAETGSAGSGDLGGQSDPADGSVPSGSGGAAEDAYALPDEELTGIWREDVVLIAESQVGCEDGSIYRLPADGGSATEEGHSADYELSGASDSWDAAFAMFCLYSAGIPEEGFPYEEDMEDWIAALTEQGLYEPAGTYTPLPGDLVFLDTDEDGGADTVAIFTGTDEETGDLLLVQGDSHDAVEGYALAAEDGSILGYGILPDQDEDDEEDGKAGESGAEEIDYDPAETEEEPAVITTETDEETPGTSEDGENDASGELTEDSSASGEAEAGDASEELASEEPEASGEPEVIVYTAEDGGISVSVEVPAGALPEGAELALTLYEEDSPEYIQSLARVEEAEADDGAAESYEVSEEDSQATVLSVSSPEGEDEGDAQGAEEESSFSFSFGSEEDIESCLAAMDISFLLDGEEVEPSAPAEVTMDASGLLDGQDVLSLEVWHIEESEDGTEPVLVAEVSDADEAELGVVGFTVESFSKFTFQYTWSEGGHGDLGVSLLNSEGNEISGTASNTSIKVNMPYKITVDEFVEKNIKVNDTYTFLYATVSDPNYGDEDHTFDVWPNEAEVGAQELYGNEENPVVSITIDGTAAADNPNYNTQNVVSKTWHFTLTFADGTSVTIPIYGNQNGKNDNGGKYSPKNLVLNLYFEGQEVVLNLGNGNGTDSDGDYTGSSGSGGSALRYGTGNLKNYIDEDGFVTINLPSDENLADSNDGAKTFTVVNAVGTEGEDGYLPAVDIELGKEQAYDYELVGWINIATGEYYDVSGGSATAEVDLGNDNVFYADWIAADYDKGSSTDDGLRDDTVSTADFVTIQMFDYNELFNLYSLSLEQNGTEGETWTDSESLYNLPLLSQDADTLKPVTQSFIFQNGGTTYTNSHVISFANPARWNLWTGNPSWEGYEGQDFVLDAKEYWYITGPDSTILGMLYDTDEQSLGVHYVGDADYLFWIDEDGYYTYDSAVSGAAYNQSDGRFYVYNDNANAFFPYNGHTDKGTGSDGSTDYWFGMCMEVEFYLPTATSEGTKDSPVNQVTNSNGVMQDMVFNFSGDDDILVFIDDKLVVDMSGIHSTSYSCINFSTNTVTYSMGRDETGAPATTGNYSDRHYLDNNLDLSAGNHTMKVYYMERGASASNLEVQFNLVPLWEYESGPVQTVTVEKTWMDSNGNVIEDTSILDEEYGIEGVEVGLFDALGEAVGEEENGGDDVTQEAVFGYTRGTSNGSTTYTVTYEDDSGVCHQYVYTAAGEDGKGASLTYTQGHSDSEGDPVWGEPVVYDTTGEDGKVLDENGYVIAWLEGSDGEETLHIRIDEQTLCEKNDWSYAWELLDPDGNYEVLELDSSSRYATTTTKEKLTSYEYWSIIGDREIEKSFENGETLRVILTEAAQEAEGTLGSTKDAMGWVIVATENGVTTKQVEFSQIGTLELVDVLGTESGELEWKAGYYFRSICGVTSRSEIKKLGSGAVWYVEDAGHADDDVTGGEVERFYLYCCMKGQKYYLALNETQDGLVVTTDETSRSEFYYDSLGELMIRVEEEENSVRVTIDPDGNIVIREGEIKSEMNDVRIYTLKETETTGWAFSILNNLTPDIILQKVDADTGAPLSGVEFTLQKYGPEESDDNDPEGEEDVEGNPDEEVAIDKTGWYYTGVDPDTGEPVWSYRENPVSTADWTEEDDILEATTGDWSETGRNGDGSSYSVVYQSAIKFGALADGTYLLTEVNAPDGYNKLPSAIVITIENGGIAWVEWEDGNTESRYPIDQYVKTTEGSLTIVIGNTPGASLPLTGGGGILRFTLVGLGIVVAAGGVLTYRHVKAVRWRKSHVRGRG